MVLVLCIADLHIPHRASDLPPRFKDLLQPGKITHILCPGNLCCRDTFDYLKSVSANLHLTKGDFDDLNAPEDKVLNIESFKIGICHGHQVVPCGDVEALAILQRRLDVDILITGHTHKFMVHQYEDRLLINPGSATGAYSIFEDDVIPSFILMDITGRKVDVYIYQMIDGESKVKKLEFVKPTGSGPMRISNPVSGGGEAKNAAIDAAPLEARPAKLTPAPVEASEPAPGQDGSLSTTATGASASTPSVATVPETASGPGPTTAPAVAAATADNPAPKGEGAPKREDESNGGAPPVGV